MQAGVPFVISVAPPTSTDTTTAIAQVTYTLQADSSYILVANGIVSPTGYSPATPFNIDVFGSAREVSANATTTDVLVIHGSTDAPAVDVNEILVPAGTIIDSLSYGQFTNYLGLQTLDYQLEVLTADTRASVAKYTAPLNTLNLGGEAITIVASGFLNPSVNSNGSPFGLWVATAAGGNLIPLSIITSVNERNTEFANEITIYPNPSRGLINLEINDLNSTPDQINLFDLSGRFIQELPVSNSTMESIDLSNLSKGTYFVQFVKGQQIAMKKLILN